MEDNIEFRKLAYYLLWFLYLVHELGPLFLHNLHNKINPYADQTYANWSKLKKHIIL